MAISYNRLWKQLIDHGLSKTDMMHRAKISTNVLAVSYTHLTLPTKA